MAAKSCFAQASMKRLAASSSAEPAAMTAPQVNAARPTTASGIAR